MKENDETSFEVIATKDGQMTIRMETAYGPITFSYYPEEVEKGISKLVNKLVDTLHTGNLVNLETLAASLGTTATELQKNLEAYTTRPRPVPYSALEKFMKGKLPYPQGTLEQFIENLPLGLKIMLNHLASASVVRTVEELEENWGAKLHASEDELVKLIYVHFKYSIANLWNRPAKEKEQ